MRKIICPFLLFVFVIGLATCSGQMPDDVLVSPSVTKLRAILTNTRTPKPTKALLHTLTPYPTKSPTASTTFDATKTTRWASVVAGFTQSVATAEYFYSFCGKDLIADWGDVNRQIKEWAIVHCHSIDHTNRYAKIIRSDGGKVWTISLDNRDIFVLQDDFSILLHIERLSNNEKILYLYPLYRYDKGFIDGWYPALPFYYRDGLYRLDLETGNFSVLLNSNSFDGYSFSYSLSPDERYLAFANKREKNVFYVRDMKTELDRKFELSSTVENVGDFVWTPDSKKVIFVAGLMGWTENKAGTSLYIFDLTTSEMKVLLYNDSQQRVPFPASKINAYWLKDNVLNLISANTAYTDWLEWAFDIRNGFLSPVSTPTPHP
jgi:hypothetical protein